MTEVAAEVSGRGFAAGSVGKSRDGMSVTFTNYQASTATLEWYDVYIPICSHGQVGDYSLRAMRCTKNGP